MTADTAGAMDGRMGLTAVGVEVLGLGVVGVDEGEAVVQPAHLDRVPGLPQLPQPRQLVHHLLLLRHPQRPCNNRIG